MGLYTKYVLPRLIHFACSSEPARQQRQKVVPRATGMTLEIGIGSGLNLPFYDPAAVTGVWGLDPSEEMLEMARDAGAGSSLAVELSAAAAEELPFDDASFDTVLLTYTLCSIYEPETALEEMKRVLKPGGSLLFCEHGAAPDPGVRRWQDWITPVWRRIGGGCRLNRDVPGLIDSAGLEIVELEQMYIPGWRPASFNSWGRATTR